MIDQKTQPIKTKTLAWIITTLYLTVGLTGTILIILITVLLAFTPLSNLPGIFQNIIFLFIFIAGYVLALKIAINFVLKKTFIKKKYFKIIIFSVLILIGLIQILRGGLDLISFLTMIILLISLYCSGNFWFLKKTQKQLTKLQISEEQIPELKIITFKESIMIFILIIIIIGSLIARNYLPSKSELEEERAKTDAEHRDLLRAIDFTKLGQLLYEYRNYYNKLPSSLDELTEKKIITIYPYPGPLPIKDPLTNNLYGYQISSDQQKFIIKAMFETHFEDYLNNDIDGWPLGEEGIDCGIQGPNEREYCVEGGF